jgi:hypothetical protein
MDVMIHGGTEPCRRIARRWLLGTSLPKSEAFAAFGGVQMSWGSFTLQLS